MVRKGELGKQRLTSSFKYREWKESRVGHNNISKEAPKPKESLQEQLQSMPQMASELEVMKAQIGLLEEKEKNS